MNYSISVRESWPVVTLEELAAPKKWSLNGGPFGSKLVSSDYTSEGVPVIRGANLPAHSRFSDQDFVFVSETKADELLANNAHPGDVVFTQRGTLGQVGLIPRDAQHKRYVISQSQMKLSVDDEKVLSEYVYYYFRDPATVRRIHNHAFSSGVPHINLEILRKFEILLPPLKIQREVVGILSTYDDLIENNTRRIALLEEMARSLYREWFVDFRFPGHEQMTSADSTLGSVPEGWKTGILQDALILQRGFDLPIQNRRAGSIGVYAATGSIGTHDEVKVQGPGVVTGRSGSLGKVMYIEEDFWPLNTTLWVKEFRRSTPLWSFYLLSSLDLQEFNSGAAVPTLNRNDIHGLPITLPPFDLVENFDLHASAIHAQVRILQHATVVLNRTRDLLLPKLISGEVELRTSKMPDIGPPESVAVG